MISDEPKVPSANDGGDDEREVWKVFWQLVARMRRDEEPAEPDREYRRGDPGE